MPDRAFRFGVVMAPLQSGEAWRKTASRVEDLGFSTLLVPDGLQILSPLPALALAAGATTRLHVGAFVMAAPLRHPRLAAWDAHTLSVLTDGRFELGIGTGRPEVAQQAQESLGAPPSTAGQRLAQVEETIDHLRTLDGERHTPVLMAAAGPRALAVAAAKADIVTLATGPLTSRAEVAGMARGLREAAGSRADQIELAMNVFVLGDTVPPRLQQLIGADAATLIANDSLVMLRGTPTQMADELQRRRDELGISYVSFNGAFLEQAAPVVNLLSGR
jgi:probable F420-dependent oxidoreductase